MNAHQRRVALRLAVRRTERDHGKKLTPYQVNLIRAHRHQDGTIGVLRWARVHSPRPYRHQYPTKDYRDKPFAKWNRT